MDLACFGHSLSSCFQSRRREVRSHCENNSAESVSKRARVQRHRRPCSSVDRKLSSRESLWTCKQTDRRFSEQECGGGNRGRDECGDGADDRAARRLEKEAKMKMRRGVMEGEPWGHRVKGSLLGKRGHIGRQADTRPDWLYRLLGGAAEFSECTDRSRRRRQSGLSELLRFLVVTGVLSFGIFVFSYFRTRKFLFGASPFAGRPRRSFFDWCIGCSAGKLIHGHFFND